MSKQLEGHARPRGFSREARGANGRAGAGFAKTSNGHPNIVTSRQRRPRPARRNARGVRASLTVAARAHYLANLILQHHFHVKSASIPSGRGASRGALSGAPARTGKPFALNL
jgi:hypothetical protein